MNICLLNHEDRWPFGGIGGAGAYFKKPGESVSGCSTDVRKVLHRLDDGGVFIDSSAIANSDEFARLVINGPMLGLGLEPNEVDGFRDREAAARMLPGFSGSWKHLLKAAVELPEFRGFDRVGLHVFVKLYQEVGSRIGVRHGNVMRWTTRDGSELVEDIQPCECWKSVCLGCRRLRYYVDYESAGLFRRVRPVQQPDDHCPECRAKGAA